MSTPRYGLVTSLRVLAGLAITSLLALAATTSVGAERHGTSDAFAGDGVAIAWAMLRGASEESTFVVLRVAAEPGRYARIAADGVDPFTKERKAIVAPRALAGRIDLRIARKSFGDFPRTELAFFDDKPGASPTPALVVYYLGVPDTTPEFASDAALDAYQNDRLSKLSSTGTKGK
jgi:hypothetical protein